MNLEESTLLHKHKACDCRLTCCGFVDGAASDRLRYTPWLQNVFVGFCRFLSAHQMMHADSASLWFLAAGTGLEESQVTSEYTACCARRAAASV